LPFQAKTENLDTAPFEKISEAEELLGNAMIARTNPIVADYNVFKTVEKLKHAMECSEALHGYEKCHP
jgi:hypothetical protein